MPPKIDKTGLTARGTATAQGRVSPRYVAAEQAYRLGTPKGGTQIVKGSTLLNKYSPSALKRFISTAGGVVTILKTAPGLVKVGALLAALAASGYAIDKYTKWKDKRDGKTGTIGTPTPKDTGPKSLADSAKPDPIKKIRDAKKVPQGTAHGGSVKKYATGGGVRRAKTYG